MSQQPSGWYDDPSNPDMLRYWDGVTWTNHTAPKKSPTASQSTIGRAYGADPGGDATGAAAPTAPGAPSPTTPTPQGGWQQGQQPYQQSPYQQAPQYTAPGPGAQWLYNVKTTADGVPLASWGKRFAAWLIDGVILLIGSLILTRIVAPDFTDTFQRFMDVAATQDQAAMERMVSDLTSQSLRIGISSWIFVSVYCVAFWTTVAQTPGKMALGISVRRVSEPGPLPLGTAALRRLVPLAGQFVGILTLIDYLWPLWDDKRQALHDKVASTQVVEGKQPRKQG